MDNVESVTVADLDKANQNVMAFYSPKENKVVMNRAYTDIPRAEQAYANCVSRKYHPSTGKKTAIEAITAHELGHAIADKINEARIRGGYSKKDVNCEVVLNAFRKLYPDKANTYLEHTAVPKARKSISLYAGKNYHETIAEAVADVYCNEGKAKKFSKAIVAELKEVIKKEL